MTRAGWAAGVMAAAALGAVGWALVRPATAQLAAEPAAVAAAERVRLAEAKAQSAAAAARSGALTREAATAKSAAAAARARLAALALRIQAGEADIAAGEARLALVTQQVRGQQARLDAARAPLLLLTASLHQISRQPPAAVFVQPGSLRDIVHSRAVLEAALPVIETRTTAVRRELASLAGLRRQAAVALAALTASRAELTRRRAELGAEETAQRLRARSLTGSARYEADRALGLGEQARDITDLMDQLADDSATRAELARLAGPVLRPADPAAPLADGAAPVAAAGGPAPAAAPDRAGAFRLPVIGRITTGVGEVSATGVRSRGLTIAPPPGAQVVAPADGRVTFADDYRSYGKIIIIDHGDGWASLISGMAALSVAVGDNLVQGAPIGRGGAAGRRVTVELRRQGRPVDVAALIG